MTTHHDIIQGYYCLECNIIGEEEGGPLYECINCGIVFNKENSYDNASHRCPDCKKFSAKVAEMSCSECGENEVTTIEAIQCDECDILIDASVYEEHIEKEHSESTEVLQ